MLISLQLQLPISVTYVIVVVLYRLESLECDETSANSTTYANISFFLSW